MSSFKQQQNLDESDLVVDIQTTNKSKMINQPQSKKKQGAPSQRESAANNYAQQLHGDLISQALNDGGSTLPPVLDSPSLQQQNVPRKQSIKSKLSVSRQNSSISSKQGGAGAASENINTRNSSRGVASSSGQNQQHASGKQRLSEDFNNRDVHRQKSRQSATTVDSNQMQGTGRRQSQNSKGVKNGNLPPAHGPKRANSRQKLRQSMHNHPNEVVEYSLDSAHDARQGSLKQSLHNKQASGGMPPKRKPTQSDSARSLQPIPSPGSSVSHKTGAASQHVKNSHTLNPHQVIGNGGQQPSKKISKLTSNVDKQREMLEKLQEDKIRTEMELRRNANAMEDKIRSLAEERKNFERLILKATITIQRFARGFITRLKVRKVYHLQMEFEKARLDDALAQMQAMIAEQAKNTPVTPLKEPSEEQKQVPTKEPEVTVPDMRRELEKLPNEQPSLGIDPEKASTQDEQREESIGKLSQVQPSTSEQQKPEASERPLSQDSSLESKKEEGDGVIRQITEIDESKVLDQTAEGLVAQINQGAKPDSTSSYRDVNKSQSMLEVDKSKDVLFPERGVEKFVSTIVGSKEIVVDPSERGILDQLEEAESDYELDFSDEKYAKAAVVIQRQGRVMIARNNFRVALYKLILLKNIVETKVHKERMQMLYAFEQLIINTEDPDASSTVNDDSNVQTQEDQLAFIEQTGLTSEQIKEVLANETDPYLRQQLEDLYNPLVFKGVNEAEQYFENTEDIINEEDLEESVCESRKQSPLARNEKSLMEESKQSLTKRSHTQNQASAINESQVATEKTTTQRSASGSDKQSSEQVAETTNTVVESQRSAAMQEEQESTKDEVVEKKQEQKPVKDAPDQAVQKPNFSQKLMNSLNNDLKNVKSARGTETTTPSAPVAKPPAGKQPPKIPVQNRPPIAQSKANPSASKTSADAQIKSKPLQERTISSTNNAKPATQSTRVPLGQNKTQSQTRLGQKTTAANMRDQSSEQGKQITPSQSQTNNLRRGGVNIISSKPASASNKSKPTTGSVARPAAQTEAKKPSTANSAKNSTVSSTQQIAKVQTTVTRKDILEFSGTTAENLQAEQSGQINIVTAGGIPGKESSSAFGTSQSSMRHSDSGSINGRQQRQQRDNSIIERNKAKLAEFAEKKKQEIEQKKAEDLKKEQEKEAAAKPPRPFDANRLASLSQPKPKLKDPNVKPEKKPRRVSARTRQQLQERAMRVKNRQTEALEKQQKNKMLAITDGQTQGTNLVMVDKDSDAEKRRNNILKSREIRKRSAKGPRDNSGKGRSSVFDRLNAQAKQSNQTSKNQSRINTQGRQSVDQDQSNALVPIQADIDRVQRMANQLLAIEPSSSTDYEPAKPSSDVRQSYEFIVKKSSQGQNGPSAQVKISRKASRPSIPKKNNGLDDFTTLTDHEEDTERDNRHGPTQSYQHDAFSMRHLRKPSAQAIQMQDADEELEDMPFVVKGKKKPAMNVNTRVKDRQQLEPLPYEQDMSYNPGQERKAVNGASKMQMTHQSNQSSQHNLQRGESYTNSTLQMFANPRSSNQQLQEESAPVQQVVVAKPDQDKNRDWLLDPVNLYMRGMAQKREQMRKLQSQIGAEQRAEINRRVAHFKM